MDKATCLQEESKQPRPSDLSLCLRCGEVLVFSPALELLLAMPGDLLKLDAANSSLLLRSQKLIRRDRPLGTEWHNP